MNLMYALAKVWRQSFVQFPHTSSYIQGVEKTKFADDAFMNFSPDMKTYHLPDSGGSYLSRFNNDTSHILLTMVMEKIINYKSIYLTVILLDSIAYASHNISKLYHLKNETTIYARKIFKRRMNKSAQLYSTKFRYINIFNAIIDDVFIMPNVNHHDDTILTYLNRPHIKETLGWTNQQNKRKSDILYDMRESKLGVSNKYIGNVDTPVLKRYDKLSDVLRERADTFSARYANESRNHNYLFSNPIRIESWTADIARSTMKLSDSSELSSSTSSSSSSRSSSTSVRPPPSSPSILPRSPTHRQTSLYSAARKSPSPILNRTSSSSSATSSSSQPTLSNNNDVSEQVGDNNVDLATFSRNREHESSTRFSTPTKRRKINSLIGQH